MFGATPKQYPKDERDQVVRMLLDEGPPLVRSSDYLCVASVSEEKSWLFRSDQDLYLFFRAEIGKDTESILDLSPRPRYEDSP